MPAQRKSLPNPTTNTAQNGNVSTSPGPFSASPTSANTAAVEALQAQVDRLVQAQEDMTTHVRNLERNYQEVLVEMVNFQRNIAQQDGLMQNLIQYFLQVENGALLQGVYSSSSHSYILGKLKAQNQVTAGGPQNGPETDSSDHNPFLPTQEAQRMMGTYPETAVARASLMQMNEISRRAEVAGMSFSNEDPSSVAGPSSTAGVSTQQRQQGRQTPRILATAAMGLMGMGWDAGMVKPMSREETLAQIEELQRSRPTSAQGFGVSGDEAFVMPEDAEAARQRWVEAAEAAAATSTSATAPGAGSGVPVVHQGLQVYTLGHLMPRSTVDDANGNWSFDASTLEGATAAAAAAATAYGVSEASSSEPQFGEAEEIVKPSPPIPGQQNPQLLRVRRSTFVPGWAVPPRVLLVDDDAVSRKLSSKFLQIFGCAIDVAVDGVGAVNKMNLEKYDLVLMVGFLFLAVRAIDLV